MDDLIGHSSQPQGVPAEDLNDAVDGFVHGVPCEIWEVKGTKISIRRLIRSNVRRCAASSHHGRKDVGVRSSVPGFLHPVAPRVGYDFDGNTRSLIIA
jgi:hypothetical protein